MKFTMCSEALRAFLLHVSFHREERGNTRFRAKREAGVVSAASIVRGRITAVVRVVSWGVGSFGALLGGILAEWFDLRTTMVVGAIGTLVAFIWLVLSPVRRVQSL